jgi:uncharacterized membrane protein
MDPLTRWAHRIGVDVYLGSTAGLALVLLPFAAAQKDPAAQRRLLARWLRAYNVASIGALGVLVVSGGSAVTDLKAALGAGFAQVVPWLERKLLLTFALILVATYVSFGLAHRLVRAEMGQLPIDADKQAGMIRRMRATAWVALALGAYTAWVGVALGR